MSATTSTILELADSLAPVLGLVREPLDAAATPARLRSLGLTDTELTMLMEVARANGLAPLPPRGPRPGLSLFSAGDDFVILHSRDTATPQTMALHEVANAMTLVVGLSERALLELGPADPRCDMVDRIARTARDGLHVARLVERSDGEFSERRVATHGEVAHVVTRVVDGLRRLAASRDVRLTLEVSADGVVANEHALAAVTWNLVKNALDAAPPGSLVHVEARGDGARLTLRVEDEGGGLDSRPRKRKGRGVGLVVVRALLDAQAGALLLEPREPRGTRAVARMPMTPHELGVTERDGVAGRARVLVVEDDAALRELVADRLTSFGWAVRATDDPRATLEGTTTHYDVALVDQHLHGEAMSAELLAVIRARATHVVAVTGDPIVGARVDRVLRKPFELDELVEVVEELTRGVEHGQLAR